MKDTIVIAGPCAVESEEQIITLAHAVKKSGATHLRAMLFKPRTTPDSFQGVGHEGLDWIKRAREETGLSLVTEILDPANLESFESDVIQIGSRNMQNYTLLSQVGDYAAKNDKTVLLKRGMSATLDEIKGAVGYLTTSGMDKTNIWFCERGVRPSYSGCRNTLDLNIVPMIQDLDIVDRVIVDPSHASGRRELVIPLAKAGIAVGADGLEVEVHHQPETALCDGPQALPPYQFDKMMDWVRAYKGAGL